MAAAVTAHYNMMLDVEETVAGELDLADDQTITHKTDEATLGTHHASSTPAVSQTFSDKVTLTGGTATLDLTSLTGQAGVPVTFADLKVQHVKVACQSDNAAAVVIQNGDSNAYNLHGRANSNADIVAVPPGGSKQWYNADQGEDVDATHKAVKFTGTAGDKVEVILVAG